MSEEKGGEGKGDEYGGWESIDFNKDIEMGEKIGGGGIGVIYKGWFRDEPVALKTLFDSRIGENLKKEYMDELLCMSKLKHSNIVKFMGACMKPPNLCFVMEMCECSLYDVLHVNKEDISVRDGVRMLIDVGSAMEYLHSLKPAIIHRDLKSHNILRAFDGTLKVCDFGLVSNKNTQAGTPAYMAPELFENKSYNKSVDTFAFGVLMWEIFAKEVPHYMCDVNDIRDKVVRGIRQRIPSIGVPPRCNDMVTKCWHQQASERPDFTTIVDELLEIFDEIPESTHIQNLDQFDTLDSLIRK